MAPKSFKVTIKVISQTGHCGRSHYVGEEWLIEDKSPGGICLSALHSMLPHLNVLRNTDSGFPWSKDPDVCRVACPDAKNPVVFELRRIREPEI